MSSPSLSSLSETLERSGSERASSPRSVSDEGHGNSSIHAIAETARRYLLKDSDAAMAAQQAIEAFAGQVQSADSLDEIRGHLNQLATAIENACPPVSAEYANDDLIRSFEGVVSGVKNIAANLDLFIPSKNQVRQLPKTSAENDLPISEWRVMNVADPLASLKQDLSLFSGEAIDLGRELGFPWLNNLSRRLENSLWQSRCKALYKVAAEHDLSAEREHALRVALSLTSSEASVRSSSESASDSSWGSWSHSSSEALGSDVNEYAMYIENQALEELKPEQEIVDEVHACLSRFGEQAQLAGSLEDIQKLYQGLAAEVTACLQNIPESRAETQFAKALHRFARVFRDTGEQLLERARGHSLEEVKQGARFWAGEPEALDFSSMTALDVLYADEVRATFEHLKGDTAINMLNQLVEHRKDEAQRQALEGLRQEQAVLEAVNDLMCRFGRNIHDAKNNDDVQKLYQELYESLEIACEDIPESSLNTEFANSLQSACVSIKDVADHLHERVKGISLDMLKEESRFHIGDQHGRSFRDQSWLDRIYIEHAMQPFEKLRDTAAKSLLLIEYANDPLLPRILELYDD